jgi:hypothetical protein
MAQHEFAIWKKSVSEVRSRIGQGYKYVHQRSTTEEEKKRKEKVGMMNKVEDIPLHMWQHAKQD